MRFKTSLEILVFGILACSMSYGQAEEKVQVRGVVVSNRKPVEEVNVIIKNSEEGTMTNARGEFSLWVAPGDRLRFTHLGMISREYKVLGESETALQISLMPNTSELDEIILQGRERTGGERNISNMPKSYRSAFGKVDLERKGSSTYYLEGKDINLAAPSIESAIGFRIPGGLSRGTNSLNIAAPSLYEVDGQIFSDISWLNLLDVEHVYVEKSLSGTLKYGALGRGGVVIIKTNRDPQKIRRSGAQQIALNKEKYLDDATPYKLKFNQYEKAAELGKDDFSSFVGSLAGDVTELRYLAFACQASDRHDRAIQLYRYILALKPENQQSMRDLAQAFALSGRPKYAWNTYLLGLQSNDGQFDEALSGIEFQEMKHLYETESLGSDFPAAIVESRELVGMKQPITRLVLEWASAGPAFTFEAVNPDGQVSRTNITTGKEQAPIEEFYLDSSIKGEWQFVFDSAEIKNEPLILKVSVYRNWGYKWSQPEIRLFAFDGSDQKKYRLFNLKV